MKILVTGGAGFVGSHLCDKLIKEDHKVICYDNFMNGDLTNIRHLLDYRNFKLIQADIRDYDKLERTSEGVDAIVHLAAQVHVDRSYIEPRLTYDINVMGTQNVLEVARFHDIPKVIHASTSEVYGSALYAPIDEEHPLNAPHPYGASKIAADRMCNAYMTTYGMNIMIMRFFNIFGPKQRSLGYGGVISIFTRRVLNGQAPIIYGDGNQTRDYMFVDDAVKGYDLALKYKGSLKEPINLGTGKEVTINDIATKIVRICGKEKTLRPVHVEPRIGEVKRLIAKWDKAKEVLGWEPSNDFDMGLDKFISWYRDYGMEWRQTT